MSYGCRQYDLAQERKVFLLAEGYPINFYGADSVQNQWIDLVMREMFLCAAHIAGYHDELQAGIDQNLVNDLSERASIIGTFYTTHFAD